MKRRNWYKLIPETLTNINGEGSTLELAVMHERKRKRPKSETLASNIVNSHPKRLQFAAMPQKISLKPLNRRSL